MEAIYDVLIIGGGPAGYTAALYAARAGLNTLILEKLSPGGQMALTDVIDNYPGFDEGIEGFALGMKMQSGAQRFGANTEYDEVLSVDFNGEIKKVNAAFGNYLAKTIIISTGASPKELGIPREQEFLGRGVHYCAHCDGNFYKDKTVVLVGGGNSAAADALHLSRLAKKVYLVHRRDNLRATKIYHQPLMDADNIEFLWNSRLQEFVGDEKIKAAKIQNLITNQIQEIECDGVFISIGRKPATDFVKDILDLDEKGYIVADETTKTNISGVYAIGDVRTKTLRQVVTAVADGAVAAHYAEEYINGTY